MSSDYLTTEEASGPNGAKDLEACHKANEVLNRHYPGHPWMIGADHEQRYIVVKLPYFDKLMRHAKWGFVLHMDKMSTDAGDKELMRAGGELLERFGIPRRGYRPGDEYMAVTHGLNTTV